MPGKLLESIGGSVLESAEALVTQGHIDTSTCPMDLRRTAPTSLSIRCSDRRPAVIADVSRGLFFPAHSMTEFAGLAEIKRRGGVVQDPEPAPFRDMSPQDMSVVNK